MATEQNNNSYNKPPVFDGEDFEYWKDRLEISFKFMIVIYGI